MSEDAKLVRVNTRISVDLNDWLDNHSAETALSKSTIIMLAAENYRQQKQVVKGMADMTAVMEKLEELERGCRMKIELDKLQVNLIKTALDVYAHQQKKQAQTSSDGVARMCHFVIQDCRELIEHLDNVD